jgi:hypothetical protein
LSSLANSLATSSFLACDEFLAAIISFKSFLLASSTLALISFAQL